MLDRLIFTGRASFCGILVVFYTYALSMAHAAGIANQALCRDAQSLINDATAAQLFTPGEIATLQEMTSQSSCDNDIDQLLQKKAVIEVTINPEARVSIGRTQVPLTMPQCEKSAVWLIRIVNQGFVSARLNFRILAAPPANLVILEPVTPRLTGAAVEYRALHFRVNETRQMDITLGVDAGPATSDIGERARLPVLLQCR
jgi:hypothetical protein